MSERVRDTFGAQRTGQAGAAFRRVRHAAVARVVHVVKALQQVVGAPDYDTYLAHHTRCHPGSTPLSRDEFVRRRQEDRYSRPGARCC